MSHEAEDRSGRLDAWQRHHSRSRWSSIKPPLAIASGGFTQWPCPFVSPFVSLLVRLSPTSSCVHAIFSKTKQFRAMVCVADL